MWAAGGGASKRRLCGFLTHGEDAFIFDTDDEAFAIIMRLRADPGLRARIGANARKRVI